LTREQALEKALLLLSDEDITLLGAQGTIRLIEAFADVVLKSQAK